MSESERTMKRILWWGIAACAIVPGVVLAGMAIADHARAYSAYQRFDQLPLEQRVEQLHQIGYRRDWRLAGLVLRMLDKPLTREDLGAAGYAAMRLGDLELLPILQARADEAPDDPTRAAMITYAARLSDSDARLSDWLSRGVASSEPWRQVGSAAGLMHIGRVEAGGLLIAAARSNDAEIAGYAMRELAWAAAPMASAIGRPIAWLDSETLPTDSASIDQLEQFWREHVTTKLLNDVLARLTLRDRDWVEMGRLIHARDRVANLMN